MGELKNLAKKNSNWLIIDIGGDATVKYLDFKIVPSELDPTKEVVIYRLLENGQEKYWKNGSGKVMAKFDEFKPGETWVKITRSPWEDKSGKIVEGKSSYDVEAVEEPKDAWSE